MSLRLTALSKTFPFLVPPLFPSGLKWIKKNRNWNRARICGPSQEWKSFHIPLFLVCRKGFSLLDLPWFKQLLIRDVRDCKNKGKQSSKKSNNSSNNFSLIYIYIYNLFHPGGGWYLHDDHRHVDPKLVWTKRLMMKILKISFCYLNTNQSEESPWTAKWN